MDGAAGNGGAGAVQRLISWHLMPFAAIAVAAIPLSFLPPDQPDVGLVAVAAVVTIAAFAGAAALRRAAAPGPVLVVPPLAYLLAVALLRQAEGGAASGYGPLVLIPLLWVALHGERGDVLAVVVGIALVFLLPIVLVGGRTYPPGTEWRRLLVWMVVAPTVGVIVNDLVRRVRSEAGANEGRARALDAVGGIARALGHGDETRQRICEAALTVGTADVAFLVEPDGDGFLRATALAGAEPQDFVVRAGERSAIITVYTSAERLFIPDAAADPRVSPRMLAMTGAASILMEPIVRRGERVGVLVVAWHEPMPRPDDFASMVTGLLATEAGVAIERADLLRRLDELARTDKLTGLPNRRAFDEVLERELARGRRTGEPVALALLDLDRFKAYNDAHGHQSGDELLASAARSWSKELRDADVLARWGGEEFAILLPRVLPPDTADAVIDRVRAATPAGQTCSAGVAVWDASEDPAALVARADRALYAAKAAGRDRTVLASRDEDQAAPPDGDAGGA